MISVHAPAKINLNLNITGRRDDGYHLLDSLMAFTQWGDDITITPADEFILTADGPYSKIFIGDLLSTSRGGSNLIVRAVYLMADRANQTPKFHIHVTKNIPSGAGLGGGSSDAAAIMRALNDYWAMGLSMDDLCRMGLDLGAELPVCLYAQSARVKGIGEVITPMAIPKMHIVIAWPDATVLTKDVFAIYRRHCDEQQQGMADIHKATIPKNVLLSPDHNLDMFLNYLRQSTNDLTAAATQLCPDIGKVLCDMNAEQGCLMARMSGSGSACIGVFTDEAAAILSAQSFKNATATFVLT